MPIDDLTNVVSLSVFAARKEGNFGYTEKHAAVQRGYTAYKKRQHYARLKADRDRKAAAHQTLPPSKT